jgi:hypothetical protein
VPGTCTGTGPQSPLWTDVSHSIPWYLVPVLVPVQALPHLAQYYRVQYLKRMKSLKLHQWSYKRSSQMQHGTWYLVPGTDGIFCYSSRKSVHESTGTKYTCSVLCTCCSEKKISKYISNNDRRHLLWRCNHYFHKLSFISLSIFYHTWFVKSFTHCRVRRTYSITSLLGKKK